MTKLTFEMREGTQRQGLIDLCNVVKQKLGDSLNIVEIGSYCGSGTKIILDIFKQSKVNCVDPWEKYIEDCSVYDIDKQELELREAEGIFDEIILHHNNVFKNKKTSSEYVKTIQNESIDFVYIDGNHQYSSVKEDIINWIPKIKLGGVLCGHDYCWNSVSSAINDTLKDKPDMVFTDSSWLYFK